MDKSSTSHTPSSRNPASVVAIVLLVLFVISEIITYAFATSPGLRQGPKQTVHDLQLRKLFDTHSLGQIFEIDPYQFTGLQLWLNPPATPGDATLIAEVYAFEFKRTIASVTLPVASIKKGQPIKLLFPQVDTGGWSRDHPMTIQLTLTTQGVHELDPIVGLGSTNRYSNGIAVYDDRQRPKEDLAFAALYRGSGLDMFVPVSRLAEERPGIFGWPPFYALLICATFWMLIGLVIAIAWPRPKQPLPA